MTCCSDVALTSSPTPALQRARGEMAISVGVTNGVTRLRGLRQEGCLRSLFPASPRSEMECIVVNISGGIAASDHLQSRFTCLEGSHLVLSSQGAERFLRVRENEPAPRVRVLCDVGPYAQLEWLPRETLFFENADVDRDLRVDLASDAIFTGLETRVFGRTHSGEVLQRLRLKDRFRVYRNGRLAFVDNVTSDCISDAMLRRSAIGCGWHVQQVIIHFAPNAEDLLNDVRAALPVKETLRIAASAWGGMLVVRLLAATLGDALDAGASVLKVIRRGRDLPASWRY